MVRSKWSCKTCGVEFEKRGQRDNHQQRKHCKGAVVGTQEAGRVVQRSEDGKLSCSCGRMFLHARSLRRHGERCRASIFMIQSKG